MTEPAKTNRYGKLPEPIPPEDMVTSLDVEPVPEEKDDWLREQEWFLRVAGG
jgi:hypothetical protein